MNSSSTSIQTNGDEFEELEEHANVLQTTNSYTNLEALSSMHQISIPPDKFKLVYIICILLGTGILTPWISVLTAVDYFKLKYPNVS